MSTAEQPRTTSKDKVPAAPEQPAFRGQSDVTDKPFTDKPVSDKPFDKAVDKAGFDKTGTDKTGTDKLSDKPLSDKPLSDKSVSGKDKTVHDDPVLDAPVVDGARHDKPFDKPLDNDRDKDLDNKDLDKGRDKPVEPAGAVPTTTVTTPAKPTGSDLKDAPSVPARPSEKSNVDKANSMFAADAATRFRDRWREVQAGFVDDPARAVQDADVLMDEVLDALAEHKRGLSNQTTDTEELRQSLRRYRTLLDQLLPA